MSRRVPLDIAPGIVRDEKDHAVEGRYVDGQWIRFVRGLPEKIGGWDKWCYQQLTGTVRGVFAWTGSGSNVYVAAGTQCKLYAITLPVSDDPGTVTNGWGAGGWGSGGWGAGVSETGVVTDDLDNITPLRASGSLTDPFSTVLGSNVVTVAHSSHGVKVGETVKFPTVAAEVGELDLSATEFLVATVPGTNSYTIEASQPATFTETGGGAVTYEYEIPCGNTDATTGSGWGIGGWGVGTWGTARTGSSFLQFPRFWSLENYGNDLLALPSNESLYRYDPAVDSRAQIVANAPTENFAMFLTDEGFPVLLGAGGTAMKVQWPDQSDITVWTPSATVSAGSNTLRTGSRLMGGTAFAHLVSLVWSDLALYTMSYRGTGLVYEFRRVGKECGLIGPEAFAIADGRAFWMSQSSFHFYNGYVGEVPNVDDNQNWVFDNLASDQKSKASAVYIPTFREVWFVFPAASSTEPNRYIGFNIDTFDWISGTLDRTSMYFLAINDNRPLMAGSDSYLYIHETGVDADGSALEAYHETAPVDIGDGDESMDILGFFPSYKDRSGALTLDVTVRDFPDGSTTDSQQATIEEGDTVADLKVSGRMASFKITSNVVGGDFRKGKPLIEIEPAGEGRR